MYNEKRGFTLIELLAVIVILGVIMLIAIPSVTGYITSSRKSSFVSNAKNYIEATKNYAISNNALPTAQGASTIITLDNVELESGGTQSAYGAKWDEGTNYVSITNVGNEDEQKYDYRIYMCDAKGHSLNGVLEAELETTSVEEYCRNTKIASTTGMTPAVNSVTVSNQTANSVTISATCSSNISSISKIEYSKDGGNTYDAYYMVNSLWQDGGYSCNDMPSKCGTREKILGPNNILIYKHNMNAGSRSGTGPYYGSRKLDVGKSYTWSIYLRASRNITLFLGQEQGGLVDYAITPEWKKYTKTFTATYNGGYQAFILYATGFTWQQGDYFMFHSLELRETSNTVTNITKEYTYNNLTPGNYKFKSRCTTEDGLVTEGSTINLTK